MATSPFKLTRDQLALFAQDHRQIKVFENLLATATDLTQNGIQDILLAISSAENKALQNTADLQKALQDATVYGLSADVKATQALESIENLKQAIDFLQLSPSQVPEKRTYFGSFFDTTTQTAAAINTAYAITFNNTDLSFGVRRGTTTSQIFVDQEGVYNIQFSAQLDNTSGGNHLTYIWLRVNGTNVENSASQVRLKGTDGELVAAWNFFYDFKAGDYFELMWSVNDVAVQLLAQAAAAPVPAIPSVILTVSNNIRTY